METAYPKLIEQLGDVMLLKLTKNEAKPCASMAPDGGTRRWDSCSVFWLLDRARSELDELEKALREEDRDAIHFECGDVANFVAMIYDNTKFPFCRNCGHRAIAVSPNCCDKPNVCR